MKLHYFIVLLCMGWAGSAQAEIYKSVDAEGHVTYSSTPSKGAKKLELEKPVHVSRSTRDSPRVRNNVSPSDFPKVDSNTQKNRDGTRRKILEDELAAEEKLLAEARMNLKQGESSRIEGKLHALNEEVTLHEKNVSALKTELSHIR